MQVISVKHDELSLKGRIKGIRKENHYSQVEMAQRLGVSQSVISLIESGQASVNLDILKKMSSEFNISCDWLIYGKDKYVKITTANEFIPLVKMSAKAGYIKKHKDVDYLETLDLFKVPGFSEGDHRIFEIEGDSMNPTIYSNDKVICEKINDISTLIEGTLSVAVTEKDIVVKRVYFKGADRKGVIFKSDNRDYSDMSMPTKKVLEFWEVKAKLTHSFVSQSFKSNSRMDALENDMRQIKEQLTELLANFNGKVTS